MPDPIIEIAAKSEQNDIFMIRWRYEESYNVTIYPSDSISPVALYSYGARRERWPLENGVMRPPEYFSQVLRQHGSYINMVEVCFPYSGAMTKDKLGRQFESYVQTMSGEFPETVFIGYTGMSTDLPQLLTDELQSHPQRLIQDRNTLDRLGYVVADHYGSLTNYPTRFRNGQRLASGEKDAKRYQPYHTRVAEARKGSAGAGTSSVPRGAPGTSGARVGGLDAGAENVGERALDKWFRDLGIFS